MKRIENKVAVITGTASGIGRGVAKRFFEEGATFTIDGGMLAAP